MAGIAPDSPGVYNLGLVNSPPPQNPVAVFIQKGQSKYGDLVYELADDPNADPLAHNGQIIIVGGNGPVPSTGTSPIRNQQGSPGAANRSNANAALSKYNNNNAFSNAIIPIINQRIQNVAERDFLLGFEGDVTTFISDRLTEIMPDIFDELFRNNEIPLPQSCTCAMPGDDSLYEDGDPLSSTPTRSGAQPPQYEISGSTTCNSSNAPRDISNGSEWNSDNFRRQNNGSSRGTTNSSRGGSSAADQAGQQPCAILNIYLCNGDPHVGPANNGGSNVRPVSDGLYVERCTCKKD